MVYKNIVIKLKCACYKVFHVLLMGKIKLNFPLQKTANIIRMCDTNF